ncbi:Crp/Fnr family transcriptional regulator [Roseospira goensis]|uniref:CRP-like cAMP-binding protein n=1 Tax=Roseospira goensis TaxID=391922 RepID=A0A7W6WKF2_9PROT|nr:Crp/Fnr family transcriptional regulator [Roseospira goensis]MBB4285689.1 CRP-like cAMP-binding protein [Roseospira goensis]
MLESCAAPDALCAPAAAADAGERCPSRSGALSPGDGAARWGGRPRRVPAGTELRFEGDPADSVLWVLTGWVALSKSLDDGRRQILDLVLPVDLIQAVAADGATSSCRITALTETVIAACAWPAFARRLAATAALRELVDRLAAAAAARQTERMLRLGQGTAYERVAHVLLELFVRLEAAHQTAETAFPLPITQTELGDLTGLTSVHVCRTLRRLARNGVIRHPDHAIVIRDVAELCRISRLSLDQFRTQILPPGLTMARPALA